MNVYVLHYCDSDADLIDVFSSEEAAVKHACRIYSKENNFTPVVDDHPHDPNMKYIRFSGNDTHNGVYMYYIEKTPLRD